MPRGSDARRLAEQFLVEGSDTADVDGDGRIVLAQRVRDRVRLRDGVAEKDAADAVFAGAIDTFKIWRPDDYEADKASRIGSIDRLLPDGADILTLIPGM
jgi:MraZ protein